MSEILCPQCGSSDWYCWDEQWEDYIAPDGSIYTLPVGYMVCRDCGKPWIDEATEIIREYDLDLYDEVLDAERNAKRGQE